MYTECRSIKTRRSALKMRLKNIQKKIYRRQGNLNSSEKSYNNMDWSKNGTYKKAT